MTSLRTFPRDRDAEALFWLDLAKRVLAREITPDAALRTLKFTTEDEVDSLEANEFQL